MVKIIAPTNNGWIKCFLSGSCFRFSISLHAISVHMMRFPLNTWMSTDCLFRYSTKLLTFISETFVRYKLKIKVSFIYLSIATICMHVLEVWWGSSIYHYMFGGIGILSIQNASVHKFNSRMSSYVFQACMYSFQDVHHSTLLRHSAKELKNWADSLPRKRSSLFRFWTCQRRRKLITMHFILTPVSRLLRKR